MSVDTYNVNEITFMGGQDRLFVDKAEYLRLAARLEAAEKQLLQSSIAKDVELAAQAAVIEKMRSALEGAYDYVEDAISHHLENYGEGYRSDQLQYMRDRKADCNEALAIPTKSKEILAKHDAGVLRDAATHLESIGKNGAKWYYAELRDMADEKEKQ